jgi:hypothetical protein
MADPKGAKSAPDGAAIQVANVISVEMDDLADKDWDEFERELQHELEEVMAERRKEKLTYFRKTRSGVVKKGDTTKASVPVNYPFTLEELMHMINVSVNSKFGADLEGITHTIMDSVRGSLESLRLEFKRESEGLPRQVWAVVQQVLGETKDKRDVEIVDAGAGVGSCTETPFCSPGSTVRQINMGGTPNTNFQQPYYQVHAYRPVDIPYLGRMVPGQSS